MKYHKSPRIIEIIEQLRVTRNMTQKQLIDGIISPPTYTKLKNEQSHIQIATLLALATRLNASLDDLVDVSRLNNAFLSSIEKEYSKVVRLTR